MLFASRAKAEKFALVCRTWKRRDKNGGNCNTFRDSRRAAEPKREQAPSNEHRNNINLKEMKWSKEKRMCRRIQKWNASPIHHNHLFCAAISRSLFASFAHFPLIPIFRKLLCCMRSRALALRLAGSTPSRRRTMMSKQYAMPRCERSFRRAEQLPPHRPAAQILLASADTFGCECARGWRHIFYRKTAVKLAMNGCSRIVEIIRK